MPIRGNREEGDETITGNLIRRGPADDHSVVGMDEDDRRWSTRSDHRVARTRPARQGWSGRATDSIGGVQIAALNGVPADISDPGADDLISPRAPGIPDSQGDGQAAGFIGRHRMGAMPVAKVLPGTDGGMRPWIDRMGVLCRPYSIGWIPWCSR